jgi:iron(III) transport system substrate-binding protein
MQRLTISTKFWVYVALLLTLNILLDCAPLTAQTAASKSKLAAIVEKASKEGEIVYQTPDPETGLPTAEFLRDMSNLVEKQYGVKIRIKIDNTLNFPSSVAKALTEMKSGAPPSYDLMFQNIISGIPLYEAKAVEQIPWLELLPHLGPRDMTWRGLAPIIDTQFILPIYNSNLVKPQDVPKTWEDMLDPKWKGKIGILVNYEPWALLAQPNAWGEERSLGYLRKLMELKPKLGRFPESHQRVLSGETPLATVGQRERALFYKHQRGAPMDVADHVEPSMAWVYLVVVPKGARNPNAATLVAAALMTKEGQDLHQKYRYTTSMFRPNTPAAEFAAKHKVLLPDLDFVTSKQFTEISKKVRDILIQK